MTSVQSCPTTKDTYLEASRRLGCVNDTYHHNQYICLPNTEKTSLVELCNNAIMGIQEKGSCLEASVGKLIRHNCQNFSFGCPKNDFWEYEYYNYPACQYINTKHHCYVMDPSCPADVHTEENNNHQTLIFASSVIGGLLVVLIIAAGFFFWRQRTQQGNENPETQTLLVTGQAEHQDLNRTVENGRAEDAKDLDRTAENDKAEDAKDSTRKRPLSTPNLQTEMSTKHTSREILDDNLSTDSTRKRPLSTPNLQTEMSTKHTSREIPDDNLSTDNHGKAYIITLIEKYDTDKPQSSEEREKRVNDIKKTIDDLKYKTDEQAGDDLKNNSKETQ